MNIIFPGFHPQWLQNKRHTHFYKQFTNEKYSIDYIQLQNIPNLLYTCMKWLQFLLNSYTLNMTEHSLSRLKTYINKKSRCNTYTELLPSEYQQLKNIDEFIFNQFGNIQIVEIGLNEQKYVCKLAFVCHFPDTKRVAYICIGMDGGVKTVYVTPTFKHRNGYNRKGNIEQLSIKDLE